ncbi:DoxX family membrane protein [Mesobacillus foraminis]|uniref:DoxX-like protein n=1 Tax=Mesobacillus foraminis TaxID=279826 RepID=A0A4V2RDJ7_9BACI|nr:DoxX family membrane protein [Mesobacillus foraminis]TCN25060.1 DoxX-like protein [Mesobacillus foraminis]
MEKIIRFTARSLLGLIFLVAGINGYFVIFGLKPFIATSEAAMRMFPFSYLLIAEKSLEVVCGLLLIMNIFIPLALAVLAPIVVNIFLLHLLVDQSLLLLAIFLAVCYGYMVFVHRNSFRSLFVKEGPNS